jgi:hypothetical protein
MHAVLWIFLAFAFALMLFSSIQDDLPKELSFLKGGKSSASQTYEGWTIRQAGSAVEYSRLLQFSPAPDNISFKMPELGILCNNGVLDLRIDTKQKTTGAKATSVAINGIPYEWDKGTGTNIFPKLPKEALASLVAANPSQVVLSYAQTGLQPTLVEGMPALSTLIKQLPSSCQP